MDTMAVVTDTERALEAARAELERHKREAEAAGIQFGLSCRLIHSAAIKVERLRRELEAMRAVRS